MYDSGFNNGVIFFDGERAVFYSGQVISGSVRFNLEQPLTFSAINIECYGEANVIWTEHQVEEFNGVRRQGVVKHTGHEEYFRFTQRLAGGAGNTSQFSPGSQALPFKFQIPYKAPSSFKGDKGTVKYHINAYIQYPGPIKEEILTRDFTVIAPFDLNFGNPSIRQPVELVFEEVYGCDCICTPEPVTVRVRLPASGYCPGQAIPIAVEVHNDSSVEIRKMIFQLVKKECYHSQHPIAEDIPPEEVLCTVKKGAVLSKTAKNLTCELLVPDMIVPNLENCGIIDVGYFIRTIIKLSGCNEDLKDESEICLGLVPLREFTDGDYVHPMAHSLPSVPVPDPNKAEFPTPTSAGFIEPSNSPYSTSCPGKTEWQRLQTAPYPAHFGPNENPPYPTQDIDDIPVSADSKPKPSYNYEIGFKSERVEFNSSCSNNMAPSNPPYPIGNMMPQMQNPGHQNGGDLRIYLPPGPLPAGPSAPPPST